MTATPTSSPALELMRWWDISSVAALERELFPGDPWSIEQFWQELAYDNRAYVVLRDGDAVVGYAGVMVNGPDADIQTIAVGRNQQRGGRGRVLLSALLASARSRGAVDAMLEVRADNVAAISLYESFGFERLATRRRYYPDGGDALVMRVSIRRNGGAE